MASFRGFLALVASVACCCYQVKAAENYEESINWEVPAETAEHTNAIATFLGFQCPKGHRCLPVLECLPCDYGTYKESEGSDLCSLCPAGCTTLRRGAESWRECVPKCPPGYEESSDGKTCIKCHPGYYKSGWRNVACSACPPLAAYPPDEIGLVRESQCYAHGTLAPSTSLEPEEPVDGCNVGDVCTFEEYDEVRLRLRYGTDCRQFCHCAHSETIEDGSVLYYWEVQQCPDGTQFKDDGVNAPGCFHEWHVQCPDGMDTSTPHPGSTERISGYPSTPTTASVTEYPHTTCVEYAPCSQYEHDHVRLRMLPDSNCTAFCQCATAETIGFGAVSYQWVRQECPRGLAWDEGYRVCIHKHMANCEWGGYETSTLSSPAPPEDPDSIGCNIGDTCSQEEHDDVRLKLLHNSDCEQFCHCAPATTNGDASTEYYWVVQTCPQGTAFSDAYGFGGCFHAMNVVCADGNYTMQTTDSPQTGPTMTPHVPTGAPEICSEGAPCSQYEHDVTRLLALPGTNCTAFCQCAPANTDEQSVITYQWLRQECPQGLAWDSNYRVCINERRASCELDDFGTTETPLTSNGTSRSTEGTCGHYLNGLEGIIEHPSPFGNRTYGNQEACTWDIEVSSGSVISLTFWVFDVEPVTNCTHDNVTLMENGIVSETLCNITIPYTYTSTTNRLTVKFASDPSVQGIGFQANWSEIANPTSTETPVSTERPADYIECGVYPADIVIVIDGSGSISPNDFQTQLQFVSRIVEEHDVTSANARARIGVVTFSDVVTDYIRLNDYIDDKDGLMARILSIPQRGGTTNTGGALRFVREVILQEGNGARQFAQNIVFVITDGVSTNAADTAAEASNLKTVSSKVFAIAVGDFSVDELYHIASNDDYVKQVQSFDALSSISNELKRESCADITAGCIEGGLCTQYEHDEIRHRLLFGTDCSTYCHCATKTTNNDGSVEYYWARVNCPGGTLFNESTTLSERICIHSQDVTCTDGWLYEVEDTTPFQNITSTTQRAP